MAWEEQFRNIGIQLETFQVSLTYSPTYIQNYPYVEMLRVDTGRVIAKYRLVTGNTGQASFQEKF